MTRHLVINGRAPNGRLSRYGTLSGQRRSGMGGGLRRWGPLTTAVRARRRPGARVLATLFAAAALTSCKTPSFLCISPSGLSSLAVHSDVNTNNGQALQFDVLFITDKAALKTISALKARDYFAQKDQLKRDFPTAVRIRELGLEPAQFVDPSLRKTSGKDAGVIYDFDPPCNLAGTLLFVDYNNDAPNRVKLTKAKAGTLTLGTDDFTWRRR